MGVEVDIEFVNQLARSQRIEEVSNIQTWVQQLGLMAQLKPEVLDLLNADEAGYHTGKIIGVPESVMQDEKTVAKIRQQRAQMQQAQMALAAGTQVADIGAKMAGTTNPAGAQ